MFPDTRSYYVAGRAALSKALAPFAGHMLPRASGNGNDALDAAIRNARAVRSVFYSLYTYITGSETLWIAIGIAALVVASVLKLVFDLLCPDHPRWHVIGFIALVALLTPISWVVSVVMPDAFTSVTILCVIITLLFWNRLSRTIRIALFFTTVGSAVMHLTNAPTAFAVIVVGALLHRRGLWRERARFLIAGAAIVAALGITLMVSVVGFKQWTLTPNAPPFLLARSIDDGPGKLYLLQHCPQIGLDMCKHLDRLDVGDDDFIWHDNGVYSTVPLDEAALLRAEDKRIYVAAALEHPWLQLRAIIENSAQQLGLFTLREYMIPSYGYANKAAPPDMFTMYIRPMEPLWQVLLGIPEYLIVLAGLGYTALLWHRGLLRSVDRAFCVLVLTAVVANATVCAFSIPAPRYEARVIWLIPMTAIALAFRQYGRRGRQPNLPASIGLNGSAGH